MEEEATYNKLPVEDRCVHKLWKARVDGYEEAAKIFREIDDEKSPDWNKFLGLVKKFVVDSNVAAQEKGLEATLIYVENCGNAGKTVGDVMTGIVQKCIAAPKAKTKELAVQVTLMYIEIEKQEAVMEELIKGMEHKNPKIVSACTSCVTLALREFGSKVINVKPLIKKLATLMSDRDKTVRDEGKALAIEIYRWIGPAMKPQLATLPPVLMTELESEFDKLKGEKAEPTRFLKSQQEKQQALVVAAAEESDAVDDDAQGEAEDVDPMDLIDPVDILSKLPKEFYEKLEAKNWKERKESLDALEKLLENPKLESGDYGDLVRALKKVLTKDSNVLLVAQSGKCLAALARGLGKRFSIYSGACVPGIFEKFKEKKPNAVNALRDAIDAIYPSTSLEAIQEDIVEALNNKNPSIKAEVASFLARAFTKTQPAALNKKLLKLLVTSLLKTLNESDVTVRDASAEALGTLLKLMGEKAVGSYLTDVDSLKMAKIKECQEKAVITVKIIGAKKERPATAPAKQLAQPAPKGGSVEPKPVTRPASAGFKKTIVKKATPSGGAAPLAKSASTNKVVATEKELTPEEVACRAEEVLATNILSGLTDSNWKTRLEAVEGLMNSVNEIEPKTPGISQVLIRTLSGRKPGLKETNFQVLKVKLEIIRAIAEKFTVSTVTADFVVNEVTEKLGDTKNSGSAAQALTALSEATKLEFIVSRVMAFAFDQKSPKVQSEALNWVGSAIKEFGLQVNAKPLIDDIKKAIQSTNPTVRGSAISLIGVLCMYMGNNLIMFFENEKPALKTQIEGEMQKNLGQKPPPPMRGVKKTASSISVNIEEDDDGGGGDDNAGEINVADLLPRIDISSQITESLLAEFSDKNWKVRNEGLTKLQAILNDAKLIKPSIGDLPQALALRLVDSNAKIAQTALTICEQLAAAMGPACKTHVRTLFPGFLHGLGDSKVFIRAASLTCINVWVEQCGYKEFFEGEMIADSLKAGSPALKTELWGWLAEKLPNIPVKSIPREELVSMLPHLYANISDRNADVRKNANEAVLGIMIHLGYEAMLKALDKQKPASRKDIQAALDKARPNLPVKPLPKSKQQAPIVEEPKPVKVLSGRAQKTQLQNQKAVEKPSSSRKKEEEVDTSPLLAVNHTKNQRLIDEQKLRVLKWTFTTPREEFSELLREQMTTANVNKGLMANMFHEDFRYHLKVIDSLIEDLPTNSKALICNLDLILKWVSLRFYDTNPSVLLKGLEYLNMVFQMLVENEYILAENEGSSFIPHLLIKIGDPKDTVRNGVRTLLRQICLVYPFTKVFAYIMEGLKSKNARQRTECLDELGYLIETYGMCVCQPTPQAALKEIARHISDRDNSVRNAALNCVVQAYFINGDKVYKLIGQLNEKDLSMLDERIKRARKTRKPVPVVEVAKATSTTNETIEIEEPVNDELPPPEETHPSPVSTRSIDTDTNRSQQVLEKRSLKREALADTLPKLDPNLVKIIRSVASTNSLTARAAMNELTDIIESPEKQAVLRDYEEIFIQSILAQFKNLSQQPVTESLIMYQPLLSIIYSFFNSKALGKTLSIPSLKNIMSVLLGLMADQKLSQGDDGQYTKVVNGICLKILDKTNFTNLNCALIRLLKETCPSAGLPKFSDLLMKCLWRNVKMMPERSNELDYDAVLYEVHEFMLALPSAWWQQRPSDTPLRTVKTIIHNMAKIKGNSILQHLNKIPTHSELHAYLIRILKNLQRDANGPGLSPQRSNSSKDQTKRLSNQTETMSQIFKLISDKETSRQGLLKLYEFKEKNPEVDVVPFLKGASPSFQKYIEDGLAEIDRQRQQDTMMNAENKMDSNLVSMHASRPENKLDPEYWMEKLHGLRAKANLAPIRNPEIGHMVDNKVADENLNLNQISQKVSSVRKDKPELSPHRLEHLQQKLAQLKQQKQT